MGTHFLKDSLCYLSTNIHTLKCIIYYSFTLQGIFVPYIHTLCNIFFMPYIFTHISAHPWKTSPMLLRCKVPIMGQPKFLQTSPYFHTFLILKPNFGFLAINMFPCIEATSLGSQAWDYNWASILTFLCCPYIYKTAPPSPLCKNHIHISLGHFIEHLVGACLDTNCKIMGAMWHAPLLQNTT